ncbi:hypothetical protein [Allohahella sp. A8]|uniref:hypothetical protein n=1 Tax=Allohahella sp. A8 TaxID=3141461 RepID=UPI0026B5C1F3|tara:strand:+ start:25480 stop:25962 length:483 start_codon:yes stop_codon:yes gene_type:complete
MMNKLAMTAAAVAVLGLSACASIVSDADYPVTISSYPAEATYTVVNKKGATIHQGVTPSIVTLPSGAGYFSGERYHVTVTKEGYEATSLVMDTDLDGWYFGNLVLGGILGALIVDPITGAMWRLPDSLDTTLQPSPVQPIASATAPVPVAMSEQAVTAAP